jgi:hypothetical protein
MISSLISSFIALEKHNCHYMNSERCFFEVIGVVLGMEFIFLRTFSFYVFGFTLAHNIRYVFHCAIRI